MTAWVRAWVRARRGLRVDADRAGNLLITQRRRSDADPLLFTAHMDHPAFVVREVRDARRVVLEFRGGVHAPYFEDAAIEIFDEEDGVHRARILELDAAAKPFKVAVAKLSRAAPTVRPGDVGRWALRGVGARPAIQGGHLRAPAVDDLAGAAAALSALDVLRGRRGCGHVGVLLTTAEEIGFVGATAACRARTIPSKKTRLVCLETSRSFADSPIGAGPIVRVGDRISVFSPKMTNLCAHLATQYEKQRPGFSWQRKLMAGGSCEASTFASFGYDATCICVPLGNYHNMADIDGVLAGRRPARVAPEFISIGDWRGMVELLVQVGANADAEAAPIRERMVALHETHKGIVAR